MRFKGFSLIELSIALIVVGIISGIVTTRLRQMSDHQAHIQTKQNQEAITHALARYVIKNNFLPCPSKDIHGYAMKKCHKNDIATGFIPYRELGIQKHFAQDGHHNWLRYTVYPPLTNPYMANPIPVTLRRGDEINMCWVSTHSNQILTIVDEYGHPTHNNDSGDPIAFVVESMKSNGNDKDIMSRYIKEKPGTRWLTRDLFVHMYVQGKCPKIVPRGHPTHSNQRN